jgi:hypothetical protein
MEKVENHLMSLANFTGRTREPGYNVFPGPVARSCEPGPSNATIEPLL